MNKKAAFIGIGLLILVGGYYWWVVSINTSIGQHPFTGEPLERSIDTGDHLDDKSRVLQLRSHVVVFDQRSYDRVTTTAITDANIMQLTDEVWQHIQQSQSVTWLRCQRVGVPADSQELWGTWAWEVVLVVDSQRVVLMVPHIVRLNC